MAGGPIKLRREQLRVAMPDDITRHKFQTAAMKRVSDFVLGTAPADIPQSALDRAALHCLDTLGICAAATLMEAGRIARDVAWRLYGAGADRESSPMLFDGRRVSLAGALFAAATQTDNLDGHDGYNPTKGHIGVVTAPALAVLGQCDPALSGRDALAALVIGTEIAGRAGIALHATVSDYHTSGAWNALGVVAMAARLRGLSPAQLREAFGIAEYHGPRSQMMREIATPTMLHDGSGMGGLVGISAAVMAEAGFTGAPAVTIEARDVAQIWQDLGRFWLVEHQYIKPYPVCRWAHAAIDAAAGLCMAHGIAAREIAGIRIASFHHAAALFAGMPATTSQAQYSLPFAVAARIVHGRIGLEHISGAGLSDREVARLVAMTEVVAEPRHEARFPAGRWGDVTLTLADGRTLASGDVHASGGPERPFTDERIIAKYMEFAVPVLGERRASGLRDAVLGLASPAARLSAVTRHLFDPV